MIAWFICQECEHSNDWPIGYKEREKKIESKNACMKNNYGRKFCRNYKRSKEKYYNQGFPFMREMIPRLDKGEPNQERYYLQCDELFDEEHKQFERRKKKLEITFSLQCTRDYLMKRFGKPSITLIVKYDYRKNKVISMETYSDGEKLDCNFAEIDLENIQKKSIRLENRQVV